MYTVVLQIQTVIEETTKISNAIVKVQELLSINI